MHILQGFHGNNQTNNSLFHMKFMLRAGKFMPCTYSSNCALELNLSARHLYSIKSLASTPVHDRRKIVA